MLNNKYFKFIIKYLEVILVLVVLMINIIFNSSLSILISVIGITVAGLSLLLKFIYSQIKVIRDFNKILGEEIEKRGMSKHE